MADEMVCVRTFTTRSFAEYVRSTLEAQGIPSSVSDADPVVAGCLIGEGGGKVLVLAQDLNRAEELLADLQEHDAQPDASSELPPDSAGAVSPDLGESEESTFNFTRFAKVSALLALLAILLYAVTRLVRLLSANANV